MNKVLVYGTLKKGGGLHHYLEGAEYFGRAHLHGFKMFDLGWFPGIVPGEHTDVIRGEVFIVDDRTLSLLDEVESAPSLYRREEHTAVFLKHSLPRRKPEDRCPDQHKVFTYIYNLPLSAIKSRQITSGWYPVSGGSS